jgi:hypothetical protein
MDTGYAKMLNRNAFNQLVMYCLQNFQFYFCGLLGYVDSFPSNKQI